MALSMLQPLAGLFSRGGTPSSRLGVVEKEKALLAERRKNEPAGKVKAAWGNNSIFNSMWWLPYHDSITGESAGMRAAYRTMLRCPSVKSALLGKVLAGASLDWQIQPKNPDSPRDLECCEFLRHCINRLPGGMPQLFQTLTLQRLIDGYSLSEPVLTVERQEKDWLGKIVMADVKAKHPDHFQIATDEYANAVAVEGRGPNQGSVWAISDFVYSRYLPLYDDPRGTSDLRAAYGAYFMRDTVTKLRSINAEKYIAPFFKGTWTNQDDKAALEEALERTKANTWVAIPSNVQMEAISIANRGESDFKSFIDDCDKQILVGICGAYLQILEGQVADGRGSSTVSKSIAELFQWLLLSLVQEDVNKQLFPRLVGYNYLGVGIPSLVIGGINEEEVGKILDNIIKAQTAGIKVSKKDAYRRIAFSMPDGPDDTLMPISAGLVTGGQLGGFNQFGLPTWPNSPASSPALPSTSATGTTNASPATAQGSSKDDAASVPLLNTVGGATSITAIQTAYYANELPREAAIATATTVFKLAQPDAEKLFPPQTPQTAAKAQASVA